MKEKTGRCWQRGTAPGTFSIAAYDPDADSFGVAVTTGAVAVGATCPHVSANGAVLTQSWTKTAHGVHALELVDRGVGVATACNALLDADEYSSYRQLHGIDHDGETFAFTGADCVEWAGETVGENHTVAGNMLVGPEVIEAVSETFTETGGDLADRLLAALAAGAEAGGDKRGKVSAALLVHAPEPKLYHNLRIDSAETPIADLRALYEETKQTVRDIPKEAEEMLGGVPDEIVDFGVKY
ncbi:DUF1028 domain-containing protein [Haladaptatus sp. CMSO5]|uniref:DUF1028 domain-containing protein n=1 Tax=Haladaptatus sp. CMSO5 TaxID=3120514 RepID=UPI002FCDF363